MDSIFQKVTTASSLVSRTIKVMLTETLDFDMLNLFVIIHLYPDLKLIGDLAFGISLSHSEDYNSAGELKL